MKVNGEKMKEIYAKCKQIKVEDFDVGGNVSVKVPLIDRGKCDVSHVPAVQQQSFGTTESFYTASTLISYPAPVDIVDEDKTVSLREAAILHSVLKKDISKCNFKTRCKTSHCHCKKISIKCSSQCHKGLKCKICDEAGHMTRNICL